MGDLWLRGEYPIGPFAQQPPEQAVADVLAKAPWAAWSTSPGGIGFRYTHLDRPEGVHSSASTGPQPLTRWQQPALRS